MVTRTRSQSPLSKRTGYRDRRPNDHTVSARETCDPHRSQNSQLVPYKTEDDVEAGEICEPHDGSPLHLSIGDRLAQGIEDDLFYDSKPVMLFAGPDKHGFLVHKSVLSQSCILSEKASTQDNIILPHIGPRILSRILQYLYAGTLRGKDDKDVQALVAEAIQIYTAAAELRIEGLKTFVCDILHSNLKREPAITAHFFREVEWVYACISEPDQQFRAIVRAAICNVPLDEGTGFFSKLDSEALLPLTRKGGLLAEEIFTAKRMAYLVALRQKDPEISEIIAALSSEEIAINPHVRSLQEKLKAAEEVAEISTATAEKHRQLASTTSTNMGNLRKHHREAHPSCDRLHL